MENVYRYSPHRRALSSQRLGFSFLLVGLIAYDTYIVRALDSPSRFPEKKYRKLSVEDASRRQVLTHLSGCFGLAVGLSTWEDFESTQVRPKPYVRDLLARDEDEIEIWGSATQGMGQRSSNTNEMYTYNDIMLNHRQSTVPRWKELRRNEIGEEERKIIITEATGDIYRAIDTLYTAAERASDYDWDGLIDILQSPILQENLADACSILRFSVVSSEAKEEIGFDWGSCAWRHCGAQADAQESISELLKDVGMLEPFECMFVLDIVYRSLCDILAVVPSSLHHSKFQKIVERKPFYSPKDEVGYEDQESYADMDYEGALKFLRNSLEENQERDAV